MKGQLCRVCRKVPVCGLASSRCVTCHESPLVMSQVSVIDCTVEPMPVRDAIQSYSMRTHRELKFYSFSRPPSLISTSYKSVEVES